LFSFRDQECLNFLFGLRFPIKKWNTHAQKYKYLHIFAISIETFYEWERFIFLPEPWTPLYCPKTWQRNVTSSDEPLYKQSILASTLVADTVECRRTVCQMNQRNSVFLNFQQLNQRGSAKPLYTLMKGDATSGTWQRLPAMPVTNEICL
jgi:hypothetical protein